MARSELLAVGSFVFHGVLVGAIGLIHAVSHSETTAIEVSEVPAAREPEPPPPAPPREEAAPRAPTPRRALAPRPSPGPARPVAQSSPGSGDGTGPDFGLEGVPGGDGLAVGGGAGAEPPSPPPPPPPPPPPRAVVATCSEPLVKAKPIAVPTPSYPDSARDAAVEGRVRIALAIDDHGTITSARVLSGPGHGLDEAALSALRSARFEPARRCGRGVASSFTIALRFAL